MRGLLLLVALGVGGLVRGGDVRIVGKVTDENQVIVPGARVWVEDHSTVSDHAGSFTVTLDHPGEYRINAQREGFFVLKDRPLSLSAGENLVTLVMNTQREIHDSVEVSYSPPAVNPDETVASQQLVGTELLGIPYPNTNNLKNALPAIPGIVQDSRGQVHIQGGGSDQTFWSLDGFNITDPLTGRLESRLSVDGIRTIEVATSRYSAETGKGSAGAVQIRTAMGDDRWRPSATNFIPGIENHKGLILANWTPRATFAGPLRRGRIWFSDSIDARYEKNVVEELPKGSDRNTSWRGSNLARVQMNLTPSHILTTSWLMNYWDAPRNGLGFLDPMETTVDRSARQNFVSIKEQAYFGAGALLEIGYAATRASAREAPQGKDLYILTPDGRRGNFFLDTLRRSGRDQWLANAFFPSFRAGGSHQIRAGVDLDRVTYYQLADRHPYEALRSDGTRSVRVDFAGNGELRRKNFEASSFVQDRWKPASRLLVETGLRVDWDQIVRRPVLSPRVSLAFAVPGTENTKIAAGFGIFHDATNLRVLSRHLDQYSLSNYYGPDGRTLRYGPAASAYLLDDRDLRVPVYRNFSLGVEQLFPWGVHGRFEFVRKRGRDGFTFINSVLPNVPPTDELLTTYGARQVDSLYVLQNARRDIFDSFEITLRKTFRRQSELLGSYTRSRALSIAVVDVNVDDPLLITNNEGRLPWDAPNRFLSWGIIALSEKNGIAYLAEWRDGFPFFVSDDENRQVGKNQRRYPVYLSINLHFERKFVLGKYRWAWRGGFNNLTNRFNPTVVNSNTGSSRFLQYSGGQHRAFVLRIRWLGKK